jgi:formylglycine-generating enzyme required for sulfatase activity
MAVIDPADPSTPRIRGGGPRHRFAIATTEMTIGQYRAYDPDHWARDKDRNALPHSDPDLAAFAVSYHDAARYCNWLSRQEGLPSEQCCYLSGPVAGSMVLAPDYPCRQGYRLPTLQEWECAARAGTTTDRYFGQSLDHAADYAWFNRNGHNHAEPVGRKRPNDAGLFDALGNLLELCYNPDPPHDLRCACPAARGADCRWHRLVSIRGGSFYQAEGGLTVRAYSPTLDSLPPEEAWHYIGFRIARSEP